MRHKWFGAGDIPFSHNEDGIGLFDVPRLNMRRCLFDSMKGQFVSVISTHDMERYRQHVATIDMADADKDELILVVAAIMQSFVDEAFGLHPVQLSLSARANSRFIGIQDRARIGTIREHEPVDLDHEGAINEISYQGPPAP